MKLCYTTPLGSVPVVVGDIIPASQTLGQIDIRVLGWDVGLKEITGVRPGGRVKVFTADDLNLQWVEELQKSSKRQRADAIKDFRCRHLIAVLENPKDLMNIASVIRNVNALGVEKVYIVDPDHRIPDDWEKLRHNPKLSKLSVSASKWSFVKRFDSTDECFDHLEAMNFTSIVTSPHVKGKESIYLHEGDYTKAAKLAVWFGTESCGISDRAVERSSMCVAIPMYGMVESMNLGTSSGIILYEVTKQRREYQSKYRNRNQRGEREVPLDTVITSL
jgi:tRNA (guanosine-2'-O-)-methyltransferase